MKERGFLQVAFLASLWLHLIAFGGLLLGSSPPSKQLREPLPNLEMIYVASEDTARLDEPQGEINRPIPSQSGLPEEKIEAMREALETLGIGRGRAEGMEELQLSETEAPLFLTYYLDIRERIRKALRSQGPERSREGKIPVSFTLFASGKLKEVRTPGPWFGDTRLRQTAVHGVIEASPFPPFPEGLERHSIPFRITIAFVGDDVVLDQSR